MSVTNQIIKLTTHFVIMLVVAMFLDPEDLGLFAVAFSIQAFTVILRDGGLANALIQKKDLADVHLNSVLWVSVVVSVALGTGIVLGARPLADWYGQPRLASILWLVAIPIIAQGFGSVQEAQLRKTLRFGRLLLADSGSAVLASLVAIVAIALGAGLYGLMLRIVVAPVLLAGSCWLLSSWRPRWGFSLGALRGLWAFGGFLFLTALMFYGTNRLGALIIPALIGFHAAGVFSMARNLALAPLQELVSAVARVMFPAFSAVQDNFAILRSAYLTSVRCLATVIFPIIAALVALSPEAVVLLLPEKWGATVVLIQVVSVQGVLYCVNAPASQILFARGRSRLQFVYMSVITPLVILSFVVGAPWGVTGVAIAWTVVRFATSPPVVWFAAREIRMSIVEALVVVVRPACAAAGAGVAVRALCWVWVAVGWGVGFPLLFAEVIVGGATYCGLCLLLLRDTLRKIKSDLITSFVPRRDS